MPVVEYIQESEHESSGRTIPKGSQHIVSREKARQLEEDEIAVTVGSKSNKAIQDRTRGINNLQKGQKSRRVKKKAAGQGPESTHKTDEEPAVSTDMSAKKAISHIKNTKKADLEGFVSEKEDRKTVLAAWESKQ